MPRNAWVLCLPVLPIALLTGCVGTGSDRAPVVVTPDAAQYSSEFQNRLADEIEADPSIPCPRDILVPECSAWKRAVIDYGTLREQIRAARAN